MANCCPVQVCQPMPELPYPACPAPCLPPCMLPCFPPMPQGAIPPEVPPPQVTGPVMIMHQPLCCPPEPKQESDKMLFMMMPTEQPDQEKPPEKKKSGHKLKQDAAGRNNQDPCANLDDGKNVKKVPRRRRTRSKSRELRASIHYVGCDCEKRNGLQDDCKRTGCHGSPACLTNPPTCSPSKFSNGKHLAKQYEDTMRKYKNKLMQQSLQQ